MKNGIFIFFSLQAQSSRNSLKYADQIYGKRRAFRTIGQYNLIAPSPTRQPVICGCTKTVFYDRLGER